MYAFQTVLYNRLTQFNICVRYLEYEYPQQK